MCNKLCVSEGYESMSFDPQDHQCLLGELCSLSSSAPHSWVYLLSLQNQCFHFLTLVGMEVCGTHSLVPRVSLGLCCPRRFSLDLGGRDHSGHSSKAQKHQVTR